MTTQMTTEMATKLAAFSVALLMNLAMIGGVATLFDGKLHGSLPMLAAMPAAPAAITVSGSPEV